MKRTKVKDAGKYMVFLFEARLILWSCSDDNVTYPNHLAASSSNSRQNGNGNWMPVEPVHDQRPKALPKFDVKVGSKFPVGPCPLPVTFYKQMLPDSLFDYIVMCTNTRACLYFNSVSSSSSGFQQAWKFVELFSRFWAHSYSTFRDFPWWNEKILCGYYPDGHDS